MLDIFGMTAVLGGLAIGGELVNYCAKSGSHKSKKLATSEFVDVSKLGRLNGLDGLRISKTFQLNATKSMENVVVIGATGEGKTTCLFYPNLLTEDLKGSIIVSDPKGELYRDTSHYQRLLGRKTILFSPLNPLTSSKYNPLEQSHDTTEVSNLAQTILLNGAKALEIETGVKAGERNGYRWQHLYL
jgi:type IV secretion system protein VirD4